MAKLLIILALAGAILVGTASAERATPLRMATLSPGAELLNAANAYMKAHGYKMRATAISCKTVTVSGKKRLSCRWTWNRAPKIACPLFKKARAHAKLNSWVWYLVKCPS
jgi:hypothetical protein